MVAFITIYGLAVIVLGVLAGFLANAKNRPISSWVAWTIIFPPVLIVLVTLPKHVGTRRRPLTLDEEDGLLGD
ncbi:MAG: hypothetical protein AAFV26_05980 [Pseudomonadota bacterium]